MFKTQDWQALHCSEIAHVLLTGQLARVSVNISSQLHTHTKWAHLIYANKYQSSTTPQQTKRPRPLPILSVYSTNASAALCALTGLRPLLDGSVMPP